MTRFQNTAETGYADGTAVTTANSDDGAAGDALSQLSTSGGPLTYSTTNPNGGALCFRQDVGTSGNAYLRFGPVGVGGTLAQRIYFLIESEAFTGNNTVIRLLNGSAAAMLQLRLTSSLIPQYLNGAGSATGISAGSTALSVGVWYRLDAWVTPGTTTTTGRVSADLYVGHDTTSIYHFDSVAFNAGTAQTPRSIEFGRSSTAAGAFIIRSDDIATDDGIGESYIGPSVVPAFGTPTLSGDGQLGTLGSPALARPAALGGSGQLSAQVTPRVARTVALSGSGQLGAVGVAPGLVSLSGSGQLSASIRVGFARAAALSGAGALTVLPIAGIPRAIALGGSGQLSAGQIRAGMARAVALSGSGQLSAGVRAGTVGIAALSGSGQLVAVGVARQPGIDHDFSVVSAETGSFTVGAALAAFSVDGISFHPFTIEGASI